MPGYHVIAELSDAPDGLSRLMLDVAQFGLDLHWVTLETTPPWDRANRDTGRDCFHGGQGLAHSAAFSPRCGGRALNQPGPGPAGRINYAPGNHDPQLRRIGRIEP